ncbi:hypothetical protein KC354_g158 [Hortaea werneckii]|nr:hypothetical protein KC354_g158 [Hortaea werneckii]
MLHLHAVDSGRMVIGRQARTFYRKPREQRRQVQHAAFIHPCRVREGGTNAGSAGHDQVEPRRRKVSTNYKDYSGWLYHQRELNIHPQLTNKIRCDPVKTTRTLYKHFQSPEMRQVRHKKQNLLLIVGRPVDRRLLPEKMKNRMDSYIDHAKHMTILAVENDRILRAREEPVDGRVMDYVWLGKALCPIDVRTSLWLRSIITLVRYVLAIIAVFPALLAGSDSASVLTYSRGSRDLYYTDGYAERENPASNSSCRLISMQTPPFARNSHVEPGVGRKFGIRLIHVGRGVDLAGDYKVGILRRPLPSESRLSKLGRGTHLADNALHLICHFRMSKFTSRYHSCHAHAHFAVSIASFFALSLSRSSFISSLDILYSSLLVCLVCGGESSDRASRALSIPVALSAAMSFFEDGACLAFAALGRHCGIAVMARVSLGFHQSASKDGVGTYALLLSLAPFFHCSASAASALAFSFAFLPAATSAFFALPAAFLLFSPAAFLPAIFTVAVRFQSSIYKKLLGLSKESGLPPTPPPPSASGSASLRHASGIHSNGRQAIKLDHCMPKRVVNLTIRQLRYLTIATVAVERSAVHLTERTNTTPSIPVLTYNGLRSLDEDRMCRFIVEIAFVPPVWSSAITSTQHCTDHLPDMLQRVACRCQGAVHEAREQERYHFARSDHAIPAQGTENLVMANRPPCETSASDHCW